MSRSRVPLLLVLTGVLLAVVAVTGFVTARPAAAPVVAPSPVTALDRLIYDAQDTLRRKPGDAARWAQLGSAYVERARISADPGYYAKAQGALDESTRLAPEGNAAALIGLGQLANARHDFTAAATFGERARAVAPDTAEVFGVLADAYTQLGRAGEATDAVQRMLDLRPGLAAFTRASYDLELHGRRDEARVALERALAAALSPDDVAFCRYYLGELAWNAGDVDAAAREYDAGLAAVPDNVALLQGRAKVAYAQGRADEALAGYQAITTRMPLPQYVLEYAEMLDAAGRAGEAKAQYAVLAAQEQLYSAEGASDDQVGAIVAADHGDKAQALVKARAEWGRRQSVFSADALAWALHANGRNAEALEYAQRAAALGGPNATYAFHRGMILAGLGRTADARAALTEALAINPHFNPLQAPIARTTLASLGAGS
jgi:tetratricopeptide (TPR) repeat protein